MDSILRCNGVAAQNLGKGKEFEALAGSLLEI
jgi:hypothetical protein